MIDINNMYTKLQKDQTFGFKQYQINPQYFDPKKELYLREIETRRKNNKIKFPKNHKPCFMDQYVKHIKFVPGPGAYSVSKPITEASLSKLKPKVDLKLKKFSYLEQIQRREVLKKGTPSIGRYEVTKSLDQQRQQSLRFSQRKLKINQRRHPLDNFIKLSSEVPGAGQYNLTQPKKLHHELKDQNYYKKKHLSEQKRDKLKTSNPDFLKYEPNNPMYKTFTKLSLEQKKYKNSLWEHGKIDKRSTSTGFLVSPGPATYSLINRWEKDNLLKKENKYVKLFQKVSQGYKAGIYH